MMLTLIAAVSDDGFITQGRGIPWHLPDDIAHFRSYTAGKQLLVGRRTYEEMIGWFQPDHKVWVLTRDPNFHPETGGAVADIQSAIAQVGADFSELVVIGGGQVYAAALPYAQQVILTHVHMDLGQGTRFPDLLAGNWRVQHTVSHPADAHHAHAFTITSYLTSTLHERPAETINSALNF